MTWRPVETIPREEPILITADGYIVTAVIDSKPLCKGHLLWVHPYGFYGYEWSWDFDWDKITHWMPLPDLPKEDT